MSEKIIERIKKIREKENSQVSERAIEQSMVLPILCDLGWDRDDTEEVFPQYPIDNRKVDYSLRIKNENKVFIEVKKTGEELEKHQEQLLDYCFRSGIRIAILTNGIDWWFFLPLLNVHWAQRKFYSINLKSQKEDEIAKRFVDFLSRENIYSGHSIEIANQYHVSALKHNKILETIPVVWDEIIRNHIDPLVELLVTETEKKCGFLPEREYIDQFLNTVQTDTFRPIQSPINDDIDIEDESEQINSYTPKSKHTILRVIINDNTVIQENKAIKTFIKAIEHFGINEVMQKAAISSGFPLIIRKEQLKDYNRGNIYKKFKDNLYIYSNTSTQTKKQYLESVAEQLKQKILVEIINKA